MDFNLKKSFSRQMFNDIAETMSEILSIQPEDTPEDIVARVQCSLEYIPKLPDGVAFLVRKNTDDSATIILSKKLHERKKDARIFATRAMVYASQSMAEENRDSAFRKLEPGETCHPKNYDESEFLDFMARTVLMPKGTLEYIMRNHLDGTQVNMKEVAKELNLPLGYVIGRAKELELLV